MGNWQEECKSKNARVDITQPRLVRVFSNQAFLSGLRDFPKNGLPKSWKLHTWSPEVTRRVVRGQDRRIESLELAGSKVR